MPPSQCQATFILRVVCLSLIVFDISRLLNRRIVFQEFSMSLYRHRGRPPPHPSTLTVPFFSTPSQCWPLLFRPIPTLASLQSPSEAYCRFKGNDALSFRRTSKSLGLRNVMQCFLGRSSSISRQQLSMNRRRLSSFLLIRSPRMLRSVWLA